MRRWPLPSRGRGESGWELDVVSGWLDVASGCRAIFVGDARVMEFDTRTRTHVRVRVRVRVRRRNRARNVEGRRKVWSRRRNPVMALGVAISGRRWGNSCVCGGGVVCGVGVCGVEGAEQCKTGGERD